MTIAGGVTRLYPVVWLFACSRSATIPADLHAPAAVASDRPAPSGSRGAAAGSATISPVEQLELDAGVSGVQVEPVLWQRLALSDGGAVTLSAQHPRAPLGQVGFVRISVEWPGLRSAVEGNSGVLGDLSELAARAGTHEDTDLALTEVAKTSSVIVLGITIATNSGEDLRHTFFLTSLWAIGLKRDAPTQVWAGASGESHRYFDACSFSAEAQFRVDQAGTITSHCKRVVKRFAGSTKVAACTQPPEMRCTDGVVANLEAEYQ